MNDERSPLRIDLQEVFKDDTVVVFVNGEEVYHKTGVTTNWSVSIADTVEVMVPKGGVEVKIHLPLRNLSRTVDFFLSEPVYLGVKVMQDMIDIDISNKRSFYF